MKILSEGEWRMEHDEMDGLSLGWRVIQTVVTESGFAICQLGDGLDEQTARTILQRMNG